VDVVVESMLDGNIVVMGSDNKTIELLVGPAFEKIIVEDG
jgi:hypothetical protein